MNCCIFMGNLVRDPEVSYGQSGVAIAKFSIAINDGYNDKKKTYFPSFVAFGKTAETIGNTLNKGRKILVDARYTQENYEKDGQKKQASKFIVNSFEYADSKPKDGDMSVNDFGKDVGQDSEVPFY